MSLPFSARHIANSLSLVVAASALLALSGAPALAQHGDRARPAPAQQSRASVAHAVKGSCAPANGAQIIGGFAGAGDGVDTVTGDICHL